MTSSPTGGAIVGAIIGILVASGFHGRQGVTTPSKHIIELSAEADLEQALNNSNIVLVHFYSNRRPLCRKLKPIIREVATEYAGRVTVVAVNVDRFGKLAEQHGVSAVPDVKIFRDRKLERAIAGLNPKERYTEALDSLLPVKTEVE